MRVPSPVRLALVLLTVFLIAFIATAPQLRAQLNSANSQTWSQATPLVQGAAEASDGLGGALAGGDFNHDGFFDLAIAVPRESVGAVDRAGAVNVLYGSAGGLAVAGNQLWTQDTPGIDGEAEDNDRFGFSLAAGDFNGDGYGDLAVGVPFEDVGGVANGGSVNVIYGSPAGLAAPGNQAWTQDSPGILGTVQNIDEFGFALAACDVNADGYLDLAVGTPRDPDSGPGGSVSILFGSTTGLVSTGNQIFGQATDGINSSPEAGDNFGFSLACGDFDNDGFGDLGIGSPTEAIGETISAGAAHVLYGSPAGVSTDGSQVFWQDSPDIVGVSESGDLFGLALAAGDFNNDGFDDLAAGVPGESVGEANNAGAVNVIYGAGGGLASIGNQIRHQDISRFPEIAEGGDMLGHSLAAGDFDNDTFDDLAVGVRGESIGATAGAGAVQVIHGFAGGLAPAPAAPVQTWSQNSQGIDGEAQTNDFFGDALAAADFNRDGLCDLAIGVPMENIAGLADAGLVHAIYGAPPSDLEDDLARLLRALVGTANRLKDLTLPVP